MSVSRWWTEATAALGDHVPLPLAALLLVLATILVALAWYHFPAWVPRRLPRWRLFRRWRRRPRRQPVPEAAPEPVAEPEAEPGPELPDVPVATLVSLADRLARDGRYAEAVRERLRGMVRRLVDRRVLEHQPGMTVVEIAATAARSRPELNRPLHDAGQIFSDLWYGQRPARPEHDERMRDLAAELDEVLAGRSASGGDGSART
ncbi:DUF4129 domain-containing protein [Plantactinospora sp. B5E13]|uniref:DUF4129 domain-containing protein n=1 Tax=unclassified Plantactinospora TaxID=2631981 RepID=UPI00325D2B85